MCRSGKAPQTRALLREFLQNKSVRVYNEKYFFFFFFFLDSIIVRFGVQNPM